MSTRIPPPLVVLITGLAMWMVSEQMPWAKLAFAWRVPAAAAVLALALVPMLAAVASFIAARTTINPMRPARASALITDGVFRISRNPIYLGDLLLLMAYAVWLANALNVLLLMAFVWYLNRFQIEPEERALTQLFGERYRAYCARVRRWL